MPRRPDARRREELLDQLEALALEDGFSGWRVGVLAELLNCSRSTLYELAPSKQELVARVFASYLERALLDASAEASGCASRGEALVRFTEVIESWRDSGSEAFWTDVRSSAELLGVLADARFVGFLAARRLIEEGIARGEFRQTDADVIAHLVLAAVDPRSTDRPGLGRSRPEAAREVGRLLQAA